jgi:hypothetical protein
LIKFIKKSDLFFFFLSFAIREESLFLEKIVSDMECSFSQLMILINGIDFVEIYLKTKIQ